MEDSDKHRILRRLDFICENTNDLVKVTTILISKGILSSTESEEVMSETTKYEKSLHFYQLILSKGVAAFGVLIKALERSGNDYVVQRLVRGMSSTSSVEAESPDDFCGLVWFGCQPPDPNFTGRTLELNDLVEFSDSIHGNVTAPSKKKFVVVCGAGGVGKSELVRHFIKNQFQVSITGHCLWINCDTMDSALDSYTNLANQLDMEMTVNTKLVSAQKLLEDYIRKFLIYFQSEKYVIVLDGVVEYGGPLQIFMETLAMQRAGFKKPFVITTSRKYRLLPEESFLIELNDFNAETSREFLFKSLAFTNIELTAEVVDRLARFLHYNPLELKLFVDYVKQRNQLLMDTQTAQLCFKDYVDSFMALKAPIQKM